MTSQQRKWLVVNVEPKDKAGETYRIMEEAGCTLVLGRDGWDHPKDEYTEAELIDLCRDADAIIIGSREQVTRRFIESVPKLRVISKHGTGVDRIDVKAATEMGIIVTHTPVHSPVVAEHTITLMLALMKRIREADRSVRSGGWRDNELLSSLVRGKVIGILGFGRIGSEIAKRLQGWGVRILAHDPYAKPEVFSEYHVEKCSTLNEMLVQIDILSIHAVLTKETHHMIGREAIQRLKKTAYIINTARGEIVDEKALIEALKDRRIAGAALDVLEQEPPDPSNDLLKLDNVILTPHMSSLAPEIARLLRVTAMENALAALRGEIPKYVKNPAVIDSWLSRFGKGPSKL
jgi:D-3-phosphoglycerate dehydrogenase